jgi:hypothetical protein
VAGTLTWSIVPDGTRISDGDVNYGGSDLIEFLNGNLGGDSSETDHTKQPWFSIFESSLNRWAELGGLSFAYEPNDDGGNHKDKPGVLGVRGDIRISGASIDGRGDTLAFNFSPEFGGDMALDTDETSFASSSNNHRFFRNTMMHELGHAFGLSHVTSNTDRLLMEPFTDTSIDGPQLDEVRGIHFYFGDIFEDANEGAGNDTISRATDLGELAVGGSIVIGEDANVSSQAISSDAIDFVSISNNNDLDFYSFTVTEHSSLSTELTPLGGTFSQAGEFGRPRSFDADARSDLSFSVLDSNGTTILGSADETFGGEVELLDSIALEPGNYFVRVEGEEEDSVQLYMLDLRLSAFLGDCNGDGLVNASDLDCACAHGLTEVLTELGSVVGDLDLDGSVEFADFLTLSDNFGGAGGYAEGDFDCDGDVAFPDFLILSKNFGNSAANVASVPEPANCWALAIGIYIAASGLRKRRV